MTPLQAGEFIYDALLSLGEAGSNPVLEVLVGTVPVEQRHYPDPFLEFESGLRAYYHCHPQPNRLPGEHGHFHLFIQSGREQWSHLAALSMDGQGQPRAWFTTNRWVTDEVWLWSDVLRMLPLPEPVDEMTDLQQWLVGMLHLYHEELLGLWQARDDYLMRIMANETEADMLENREHYVLSQCSIDLLDKLQGLVSESAEEGQATSLKQ